MTARKTKSKKDEVLSLLKRAPGASIEEIQKTTDWQHHTVRSFISYTVRKKMGLEVTSSLTKNKVRRYRIKKQES
jgi:predicted transcriptional regulator